MWSHKFLPWSLYSTVQCQWFLTCSHLRSLAKIKTRSSCWSVCLFLRSSCLSIPFCYPELDIILNISVKSFSNLLFPLSLSLVDEVSSLIELFFWILFKIIAKISQCIYPSLCFVLVCNQHYCLPSNAWLQLSLRLFTMQSRRSFLSLSLCISVCVRVLIFPFFLHASPLLNGRILTGPLVAL